MMKLTHYDAINYAAVRPGLRLSKYADPIEGERTNLTLDEAREVAREDSSLIWISPVSAILEARDETKLGRGYCIIATAYDGTPISQNAFDAGMEYRFQTAGEARLALNFQAHDWDQKGWVVQNLGITEGVAK